MQGSRLKKYTERKGKLGISFHLSMASIWSLNCAYFRIVSQEIKEKLLTCVEGVVEPFYATL